MFSALSRSTDAELIKNAAEALGFYLGLCDLEMLIKATYHTKDEVIIVLQALLHVPTATTLATSSIIPQKSQMPQLVPGVFMKKKRRE